MGFPVQGVAYDAPTNTLSGTAPHNALVTVHVDGAIAPAYSVRAPSDRSRWSLVLTGLAAGPHSVRVGLNSTSLRQPLAITKT